MPGIRCKYNQLFAIAGIMLLLPMSASAKCGGVDYSWGADALSNAHDFTVTMMLYVVYLLYAISAIVAIIGALQIYKDEYGRRRCYQVHHDAYRRMPFHDRCHHPVPCLLRI